jgi:cation diffusion facilitator family transporter
MSSEDKTGKNPDDGTGLDVIKDLKAERERRQKQIVKTSLLGLAANLALASLKAFLGFISNSIAIVLDAVNNLSDALSSIITITGAKLAAKDPDKEHPIGHGRIEYISAMIIALIILYAGVASLIASVKKLVNPPEPDYSISTIIMLASAIFIKIILSVHFKKVAGKVNSDALMNSGMDAFNDALIAASTLAAALIYRFSSVKIEAWVGLLISFIIIKSGISMVRNNLNDIIGERIDPELSQNIKECVESFEGVKGAYDLVMHSYGPDNCLASIQIEVADTMTASEIDELTRKIKGEVLIKFNIFLTAVGIFACHTSEKKIAEMKDKITELVMAHDHVNELHGFSVDPEHSKIMFDVIIDYDADDRNELYEHICHDVKELYPDYKLYILLDADYSG